MKKYIALSIIIVALAGAAFWFIHNQSKSTIDKREGAFAVDNAADVSKIVLTDADNKTVELHNDKGVWMVNSKYEARADLIQPLLDAVTKITSLCPVPTNAHDNVIRAIMSEHIRVQIFDAGNELLKTYWVGGPTVDGQNTYMLLEVNGKPAARPHMVYIPGFRGYVTNRYNTDEEVWRSRVAFKYKRTDIKSLSVNYTGAPKNSFTIAQIAQDSFSVSPADEKYRINEVYLQKYVRQYLDFYSSVYIEAFDNTYSLKDSMLATTPVYVIAVTDKNNQVNEVKMYHMPLSKRSKKQFDELGNYMTYDIDHYHASLNGGKDFAIVQYYVFGKLLRNYRDFYFRPVPVK